MIKRYLLPVMLLLVVLSASAFPTRYRWPYLKGGTNFSVGAYAGPSLNNVILPGKLFFNQSYIIYTDWKLYYSVGLTGLYDVSEMFKLELDLANETKGFGYTDVIYTSYNGMQLSSTINNNIRLNYYTIPLTAQFHFGRVFNWYFELGPYYSFLNRSVSYGDMIIQKPNPVVATGGYIEERSSYSISSENNYKNDYGAIVGLGVMMPISTNAWGPSSSFFVNVRYSRGFVNLFKPITPEELTSLEELIGIVPEIIDPRYNENEFFTSSFVLRFGLTFAL